MGEYFMSLYEKLKAKYDRLIKESLNSNKKILIESFVEYYGEKYRSLIEKRVNEITFVYYVNWESVYLFVKDYYPKIENPDKYTDFVNFFNSKMKKESVFTKFFKPMKGKSQLPDNLIGSTNPAVFNIPYISCVLPKFLNAPDARCSCYTDESMNTNRVIFFEILSLSESTIIHEINHAITADNIVFAYKGDKLNEKIYKTGLYTDSTSKNNGIELISEELINEKASLEITKIFKQKGGDFSSFCLDVPLLFKPYNMNLYLIDEFYETFKEYIKIARISDNKNALIERIGKTNYDNFIRLVNSCYVNKYEYLSIIEQLKEKNLPQIKSIIDKMKKVENNSHEMSQQELEDYYKHLESQGFKVKRLNGNSLDTNTLSTDTEENIKRR